MEAPPENKETSTTPPPPSTKVRAKYILSQTWKFFFCILVPILYMPIFLWESKKYEKAPHALYITILMATYWVSECIPLAITSLIPIVLVPLFGISSSDDICSVYFNYVIIFLFGGCVVALAFEYSDLHTRISFFVMKSVGAKAATLLFGMMMTCMVLSCWMNNTSTTAMMVPVIFSIMDQYKARLIPNETAQELAEKYGGEDKTDIPAYVDSKIMNRKSILNTDANASPSSAVNPRKSQVDDVSNQPKTQDEREAGPEDSVNVIMKPHDQEVSTYTKEIYINDVKYWEGVIEAKKKYVRNMEVMFLVGVAVASNIGGTGVITGTGTNLIASSQLRAYKDGLLKLPERDHAKNVKNYTDCLKTNVAQYWELDFGRWMHLNVLGMLVNTAIGWAFLTVYFQGPPACLVNFWKTSILRKKPDPIVKKRAEELKHASAEIKEAIKTKYSELGKTSFHQWMVLVLFTLLVFLWIFRNPMFARGEQSVYKRRSDIDDETMKQVHPSCKNNPISKFHSTWGWSRFFGDECNENYLHDYVATMLICLLLFVLPKEPKYYKDVLRGGFGEGMNDPLLPFDFVAQNCPWGPLFMLGGGFGISKAISDSKLKDLISEALDENDAIKEMNLHVVLAGSLVFVAILTTIASNTATAVIVTPILIELARAKHVPPLYLVLPPVIGASYAFCLPISTPPNAIVYDKANMKQSDMFQPGIFLTVICNAFLYLVTISWTYYALEVAHYPGSCDNPPPSSSEPKLSMHHNAPYRRSHILQDEDFLQISQ